MRAGRRRIVIVAGVVAAAILVAVVARHALATFAIERGIGLATGYTVRFDDLRLGWSHAALTGVHVSKGGEPILDAERVDVDYALRDIFPGGRHRFGFAGVAIARPTITLIRHRDGTFNVNAGGSSPPAATQSAVTPLLFSARVRDGTLRLIDDAPLQRDLAEQTIAGVNIDASVESNARTTGRLDGTLIGRRSQSAPLERWPVRVSSLIDYPRGFAIHRVRAAGIPLRGLLNFLIHAPVARFDDGVVRNVDAYAYALNIAPDVPFAYRLGGGADLADGVVHLGPLARPVRGLAGHIDLFDDGVTTKRLDGTVAGVPLRIRGAVYDFADLRFRLGIAGDADLQALRTAFAFLNTQDVRGPMHLETLVTATVAHPLISTALSSPRAFYGTLPLDDLTGYVDYLENAVSFSGVRTAFGALQSTINGIVDVSTPDAAIEAYVNVAGSGVRLPYAQEVAADESFGGDAVVVGSGNAGFHVRGSIASRGRHGSGTGFVSVDEKGRGEFGPFIFTRDDGSSLAGALRLERPISASAGWVEARHYRLDVPAALAFLPGVSIPYFPALGGVLDGAIAAAGPPSGFAIVGHVRVAGARYDRYALGKLGLDLSGTLADLRLRNITLDGPPGRFRGDGAVAGGTFAVRGHYDGSLERLVPFTGDIGAHGAVSAPVTALVDGNGITVQTDGAQLQGGNIHGVALGSAAGTLAIGPGGVRIIAANAAVGDARAVAAQDGGQVAISAVGISAAALRDSGLPLERGRVSVFGLATLQGLRFAGSVDLADGAAAGYPVAGWADIDLAGPTLAVRDGVAALGSTYADIGGRLDGIGRPAMQYALRADVPLGDVASVVGDLRIPLRYAEGSFNAQVAVTGGGALPVLDGTVNVPEGALNGLSFRDAGGRLSVAGDPVIALDGGHVTVGTTRAAFAARSGPDTLGVRVSSPAADLHDFDDYFDQSDLLEGRGPLAFAFDDAGRASTTSGALDLAGVRLGRFPLGAVHARWNTTGGRIAADATMAGTAGSGHVHGTIVPAAGGLLDAFRRARYDGDVTATAIDLGVWVPSSLLPYPLLGLVDASGHVSGAYPRLAIGGSATLAGGQIGPYPILSASIRTHVNGGAIAIDDAQADLGFVTLSALGTAGFGKGVPLALRLHAAIPDIGVAIARVVPRHLQNISGALDIDALVSGTLTKPSIAAGFDFENGQYANVPIPHAVGNLESDLRSIRLDGIDIALQKGTAFVAGSLPLQLDPAGIGPPSAALSVTVNASGVDLAPLGQFLPGDGTKLGGTLAGRLAIEGTVEKPRILGSATLTGASYVSATETSPVRDLNADLTFNGTSVALQALHAAVGSGTLDASGQLDLPIPGVPTSGYAISVVAHAATLNFPAYGGGQIDGTAKIVSGRRRPTLSGDVVLTNTRIPFATIFRASGTETEPAGSGPVFDLGFDLTAEAGKNVRVQSSIIDVGATGTVTLTGTLRSPRAAGELTATRGGYFSTYQRLFRISDATVTFDPTAGIVPNLDLHATAYVTNPDPDPSRNPIGSANVNVAVTGPADSYTITFTSTPPYAQGQILALLAAVPFANYSQPQGPGYLRGAPAPSNVLLPPGVTVGSNGSYTLQNEAFSLLNTQITQRFLSPLETFLGGGLGLTDLQLTLDYGGRVGFTARQELSRKRQLFATLNQVLSYPTRTEFGLQSRPDATSTISFIYFQQNGLPYYQNSIFGNTATVTVQNGIQPLSDRQGFNLTFTRSYR